MAKGAVGLAAGYWPEDVPRYLAVPALGLDDALAARPARRRAEHPALISGRDVVSYAKLKQEVDVAAAAVRGRLGPDRNRLAIVCSSPRELLPLFLGAVRARTVAILVGSGMSAAELSSFLDRSSPDLLIADDPVEALTRHGRVVAVSRAELLRASSERSAEIGRFDPKSPAVGLAAREGEIVYHSNMSLLAWAVSWSAFLSLAEDHVSLTLQPLHTWLGMMAVTASLYRGATCVVSTAARASSLCIELDRHNPAYVSMSLAQASELARANDASLRAAFAQTVRAVFIAIDRPFHVAERRRIEQAFGVPVLTVLGTPATGPVLAAHPSWYLDEAVGLPVTNVDVWPLHPESSKPLAVSWEAVDCAEIGVRSPMIAVGRGHDEPAPLQRQDQWFGLGVRGLTDPTGLFYLYPWR